MAMVGNGGDLQYSRETSDVQKEILPDGTVHSIINLTRSRSNSEVKVNETIETFDEPPRLVQEVDEYEEIMPDGTKTLRRVELKSMIHTVRTRHASFDGEVGRKEETYQLSEVVPGTASAFEPGLDSDYEDEMEQKRAGGVKVDVDEEDVVEVRPDGTKVTRKIALGRVVNTCRDRSSSFDKRENVHEDFPAQEVVPGTQSAFDAGQDSD